MANINLRDFPDDLHRRAKAQAALMGISLKELITQAMSEFLERRGEIKPLGKSKKQ